MSAGKDNPGEAPQDDAIQSEIDRTMAAAEAAVSALEEGGSAPGTPTADDPPGEDLVARIEELEAELARIKDLRLRAVADLENHKKRVKREKEEVERRTVQKILPAFLPVMDNLERALEIAEPAALNASDDNAQNVEQVVTGLKMVATEFINALAKNGIEPVESVGHPFDPALHDALQQIDSPDHPPGVVVREFEKGYRMGDRLLRPARVIVAGAGSTGSQPPSTGGGEGQPGTSEA